MAAGLTLHILVSDRDVAFARHTLPHQVEVLGETCDEVMIVVNRPPTSTPTTELDRVAENAAALHPNSRIYQVSYQRDAIAEVSNRYFGGGRFPLFDFKGVPIHAYLESYGKASNEVVFHAPSDMLFGGSARGWGEVARDLFAADRPPLVLCALGGSPHQGPYSSGGEDITGAHLSGGAMHRLPTFPGRSHVIHTSQFESAVAPLSLSRPPRRADRLVSGAAGLPQVEHLEGILNKTMAAGGLDRIDFGGPGELWTLHPRFKSPTFVEGLPGLIEMVRSGAVPAEQVGDFDFVEAFDPDPRMSRSERLRRAWRGRQSRPGPLWSDDVL